MSQRHRHPTKRFSRVLVLLISAVYLNLTFSMPHLPHSYADMVCIPTVHARRVTSIMQSLFPRFRSFVLQSFRITAAFLSKGSERGVRAAVETPPLAELIQPNLEISWRAGMCTLFSSVHFLGLHSFKSLSCRARFFGNVTQWKISEESKGN